MLSCTLCVVDTFSAALTFLACLVGLLWTALAYTYGFLCLHLRMCTQLRNARELMPRGNTQPMRDRGFRETLQLPCTIPKCVPECVQLSRTEPEGPPLASHSLTHLPCLLSSALCFLRSQINDLHPNLCLRVCFGENPDLDSERTCVNVVHTRSCSLSV